MFSALSLHIILLFFFLLGAGVIGRFLSVGFSLQSKFNKHENIFFSLLIGTIILSFLSGIIFSQGITLQWLILLVALLLFFEWKKNDSPGKTDFKNGIKNLYKVNPAFPIHLISGILLIFLWQILTHYESLIHAGSVPYKDLIFYADLSQNLAHNGQENQNLFANEWFSGLNGISPYHYFELWINALTGSVSGNHLHALLFITNAWFLILTWLGFTALASRIRKKEAASNFLFGLAALWLVSLNFGIFTEDGIWKYADPITHSPGMVIFQKTAVAYPFFLAAWLLWLNGKIVPARLVLLFLPIVSVALAPAVILSIGAISISDLIGKNKNISQFFRTVIYLFVFVSSYFLMIRLFGNQSMGEMGFNQKEISSISELSYIADVIYFIQSIPLIQLAAIAPWLVLLLISYNEKWKQLFQMKNLNIALVVFTFWSTAFLSWQLLAYQGADSMQFFNLISGICSNLVFFLIFIKAVESNYVAKTLALIFVIGGISYSFLHNEKSSNFVKYGDAYAEKILKENRNLGNPNKAFILSKEEYQENSDYHPYFKRAAWFLANDPQRDILVNIGIGHLHDKHNWNLYQRSQWETSALHLFSKEYRFENPKAGWKEFQMAFIQEYDVKMLFLGKGVEIPEWIEPEIIKTFEDPISGEKCLILEKTTNP